LTSSMRNPITLIKEHFDVDDRNGKNWQRP
jgi:hypothetical protein